MDERAPGARKGSRKADRPRRTRDQRAPTLLVGTVVCVAAWVALVLAAIRFGQSGRGGDGLAWAFLGVASLGAVACLFLALVLGSKAWRSLGFGTPKPEKPAGGKRSAGKRAASRH